MQGLELSIFAYPYLSLCLFIKEIFKKKFLLTALSSSKVKLEFSTSVCPHHLRSRKWRKMKNSFGVMFDDILAGIFAGCLMILLKFASQI